MKSICKIYYKVLLEKSTFVLDFLLPRFHFNEDRLRDILANSRALPLYDRGKDCYFLLPYRDSYCKELFWSIKFKNNKNAAELLGSFVWLNIQTFAKNIISGDGKLLIVSVPTTKARITKRGFDQVQIICTAIQKNNTFANIEYIRGVVEKIGSGKPQSWNKNKGTRSVSTARAFVLRKPELVRGRTILLLDDIVTTGSTMHEVRRLLLTAGAKKVVCFAVAH